MKRIICILCVMTVIVCCGCSAAAGETHIGIQGTVLSGNDHKSILFDLFREEDGTTLLTSTLTPDYAIQIPTEKENKYKTLEMLFDIRPESIVLFTARIDEIYQEWLKTRNTASYEGIYTGSLFEKAASVCSAEYMLSDLVQYIKTKHHSDAESGNEHQNKAKSVADMLLVCFEDYADAIAEEYNPLVRTNSYDDGRYITVNLLKQGQVIMTVSLDNTKDDEKRILVLHRENSTYYFRDMTVSLSNNEFTVQSDLYSGKASLFENVSKEDLLISEYLTLTGGNNTCSMTYNCGNEKTGIVLSAAADILPDRMEAGIFLQDNGKENIHVAAVRDTEKYDINGKTNVLQYNALSDNAEYRIALMSGVSLFAAECIPMLPESSQNMIYQMIFDQ